MVRVSVCMAVYNGEKFIKQQIESILKQLTLEDEIIISDDGSTDGTLQIVNDFRDCRIKIVKNAQKHGFVGNFENALRYASGNFIFFSDQDDVWELNKIERCLYFLQKYDLVVHNALLVDSKGESLNRKYFDTLHNSNSFLYNFYKTRFLGCCMAFNRKVLKECLPFPRNIVAHDYWIGMYWLFKYHRSVYFLEETLMCYRRHGGNVSTSSEKSNNSFLYKILIKRFYLLKSIIKRFIKIQFKR